VTHTIAGTSELESRGDPRRGEIVGTWRRAGVALIVQPWRRLSRTARDAVQAGGRFHQTDPLYRSGPWPDERFALALGREGIRTSLVSP
jgi:hypothetical protein